MKNILSMREVYLIGTDDGLYKIGISNKSKRRIKEIRTGNPHNPQIIKTYLSEFPSKVETMLHNFYSSKHYDGEWYQLLDVDVENFESKCKLLENNYLILKESGNPFI